VWTGSGGSQREHAGRRQHCLRARGLLHTLSLCHPLISPSLTLNLTLAVSQEHADTPDATQGKRAQRVSRLRRSIPGVRVLPFTHSLKAPSLSLTYALVLISHANTEALTLPHK